MQETGPGRWVESVLGSLLRVLLANTIFSVSPPSQQPQGLQLLPICEGILNLPSVNWHPILLPENSPQQKPPSLAPRT